MEKRNSQLEHRQQMEQTRGLFCTSCHSGVTRCPSQHQYHFWRMSSMFEAYCTACELGSCQSNLCHSWGYERLQKSKNSLRNCTHVLWRHCNVPLSHGLAKIPYLTYKAHMLLFAHSGSFIDLYLLLISSQYSCAKSLIWVHNLDKKQCGSRSAGFIRSTKAADLDQHCFHKRILNFETVTHMASLLG